MEQINLIETKDVYKYTPMGGNVGVDKFVFLIGIVQKTLLEPVLGTKLYKKIINDYKDELLVDLYEQMYDDYIKPFVVYATYAKYVHSGNNRIRNNGDVKTIPNNSQIMTNQENISTESEYQNLANQYLNDLEKFLCVEGNNVPEYRSQDNRYDKRSKNNDGYSLTWWLGSGGGCCGGNGGGGFNV